MCGRFTQVFPLDWIEAWLGIDEVDPETSSLTVPRANIAPSQRVAIVSSRDGIRTLSVAVWGFSTAPSNRPRPINARRETVARSAMFAASFAAGRCLVPASGFYEWESEGRERLPHYFESADPDDPLLRLAAVAAESAGIPTFAIVTTAAVGAVARIHDRMPLLLARDEVDDWLGTDPRRARTRLSCVPTVRLASHRVSARVNDPRAEGLDLLASVEAKDQP